MGGTVPAAAPQKARVLETTAGVTVPPPPAFDLDEVKKAKAKEAADLIARAHLAKAENPAPVIRRPVVAVPPPPQKQSRAPMLMMAAAVIVGAIGAVEGARRLGFEWPGQDAREAPRVQTAAVAEDVPPPARRAISRVTPSTAKVVPQTDVAPETKVARPAARPKTVRVAEKLPTAPTGRFFESNDVDQPPRVASRVAPRLPANLPAGADKKIAVARVLVSSTGHPYHVSLLRGSTLGRASDEAVVAAVTQWTFSPAKKRGEAVNCWYNIGVPLGHAD